MNRPTDFSDTIFRMNNDVRQVSGLHGGYPQASYIDVM